jgi:hypothetical protein
LLVEKQPLCKRNDVLLQEKRRFSRSKDCHIGCPSDFLKELFTAPTREVFLPHERNIFPREAVVVTKPLILHIIATTIDTRYRTYPSWYNIAAASL